MTLAYLARGNFMSDSVSVTLPYPTGIDETTICVALVDTGHPTANVLPNTPDGWALLGRLEGGGGTYGVDAGPRAIHVYMRQAVGPSDDEPTFTIITGTESRIGGAIFGITRDTAKVLRYAIATGADTSSGTAFSVAGSSNLAWTTDDFAWIGAVVNTDTSASAEAITAAGITFSAVTERGDSSSTIGADATRIVSTATVTAGTATVATTTTATLGAAATGVAAILRLREAVADAGSGTITATYDDTLSRVSLVIAGMDTNSTMVTIERSTDGIIWTQVRGSVGAAISAGALTVPLWDYEFSPNVLNTYRVTAYNAGNVVSDIETTTVTPELTQVWLKSIAHPFLNRVVTPVSGPDIRVTRAARTGVFPVKGRTYPIAVNDIRNARSWTQQLRTETAEDATVMGYVMAAGDVMLIQAPPDCITTPTGYVTIGDVDEAWHPLRPLRRTWTLPCQEVAPPGPYVVPATATWDTVIAMYGDWDAVIAANLTWTDLMSLIGDPSQVIVP